MKTKQSPKLEFRLDLLFFKQKHLEFSLHLLLDSDIAAVEAYLEIELALKCKKNWNVRTGALIKCNSLKKKYMSGYFSFALPRLCAKCSGRRCLHRLRSPSMNSVNNVSCICINQKRVYSQSRSRDGRFNKERVQR